MSDTQFKIKYDGGKPHQADIPEDAPPPASSSKSALPPKSGFRIPAAIKSLLLICGGGAMLLTSEAILPEGNRLTDMVGIADTRLEVQRVRMEKQAQAELDIYTRQVDVANQQNVERTKAILNVMAANYQADYDRTKIFVDATTRIQTMYEQSRMELTRSTQNSDVGIINLTRMFGRFADAVQPGAGQSLLSYSDNLRGELYTELDNSVGTGKAVAIEGWDTGIPSPEEVRAQVEQFELAPLPAPPKIGLRPTRDLGEKADE